MAEFAADIALSPTTWTQITTTPGTTYAFQVKNCPAYFYQATSSPAAGDTDGLIMEHFNPQYGGRPHRFVPSHNIWMKATQDGCKVHVSEAE